MHRRIRRAAAAALIVLGCVITVGAALLVTGRLGVVITSGISMNPVYYQGDLIVVAKQSSYQIGDIAAYHIPGTRIVALHRIIAGDATGFVFKGDNNQSIDPAHPTARDLVGRAVLHVAGAGRWMKTLSSPSVLGAVAFLLVGTGSTVIATRRRKRRKRRVTMARTQTRPSWAVSPAGMSRPTRTVLLVSAVAAVLGLAVGVLAFTKPTNNSVMVSEPSPGKATFSYSAIVPPSAAYDSTVVNSPDPVFRRLTNSVDLHISYQGQPGRIGITADLSTVGGWHSSITLAEPTQFTADTVDTGVQLDLTALQARADAAAAATGIPAGQVSITLAAPVVSADGGVFTPKILMTLTPLELTLAGDPAGLIVTNTATTINSGTQPNQLGALGIQTPVQTVRIAASVLLAGGLLVALLTLFINRKTPAPDEAQIITSRYGHLLADVEPLAVIPGRPVVVASFATLAKVAERAGLFVLHWTSDGRTTYVVFDDTSTYEYRTTEQPSGPPSNTDGAT